MALRRAREEGRVNGLLGQGQGFARQVGGGVHEPYFPMLLAGMGLGLLVTRKHRFAINGIVLVALTQGD
jgi:nitrogen fixation/metabolism regulation signal transduction histidine kinase